MKRADHNANTPHATGDPDIVDRFRRVDRLFQAVCELPESERETRLIALEPNDPALRQEVLGLLRAEASSSLSPEALAAELARAVAAESETPGDIPGFELLSKIGAGGMGVVYEARQQNPRRTVALKLIRPGLVSSELVRRFEFEAEALARLHHPGIAQVFAAGVAHSTLGPRPYFAMEFVRGVPLDQWTTRTDADTRDKLSLFAKVCDAVQHAHANGVIHRDLKPANILVTEQREPKVLDFGVARATHAPEDTLASPSRTTDGQLVGTLPYMSPEQVSADPTGVDTRTDVYTLGVVLFELLTGKQPHDVRGKSLVEAARLIAEQPAPRAGSIDPRLRGDIETITAKALRKEPDERYATVAAFADDVRRYLTGQPIAARPATAAYQLSRFARRNPALVTLATALIVVLVLGIGATSAGLVAAVRQAERAETARADAEARRTEAEAARVDAERQTRIAQEVTAFLNMDVLAAADPGTLGPSVTVQAALDAAAAKLDTRFVDEPVTKAAIANNVGNVYHALGEYAKAEPLVRAAGDTFERELGPGDERTIMARVDLGRILRDMGEFDQARDIFLAVLPTAERSLGRNDPRTLEVLIHLADVLGTGLRDYDAADEYFATFDQRRAGVLANDDEGVLYAALTRGNIALQLEQYAAAESAYRFVADQRALARGPDDAATLVAQNNLAAALEGLGRYDEAEPIYRHILSIERERSGHDHPDVLVTAHNLAFLQTSMGRYEDAETLFLDTLARCRRVFGEAHFGTLTCTNSLASLYREAGRPQRAADLLLDARARAIQAGSPDAPAVVELTMSTAVTLLELERYEQAEPLFAESTPLIRTMVPPGHPILGSHLSAWGACLLALHRYDDAETALIEAFRIFSETNNAPDAAETARHLEHLYQATGDEEQAAAWAQRAADPAHTE